jgi:replication initiator protein RepSA
MTIEAETGRLLAERSTTDMPDGVIYKPCGNRREAVCPSCSQLYKHDAYQIVRAGLVGGKGVPDQVAHHPAVFTTLTAPSFGEVHTRHVKRHTCARRTDCDCRPEPCHARRDLTVCPHGVRMACYARHEPGDPRTGTPLCLDCYDHDAQVVWNLMSKELWRRTTIAIRRHLRKISRAKGIPEWRVETVGEDGTVQTTLVPMWRLSFGCAAEMQRRAAIHLHAIIRLDGYHPHTPDKLLPPPAQLDAADVKAAVDHAAAKVAFTTPPHPSRPEGWRVCWGEQNLTKLVTVTAKGEVTDAQVAAYLAKYATKSTEITGHTSNRLTGDTINLFADRNGSHTQRLIDACWRLGRARWTCPACHQRSTRESCPVCAARHGGNAPELSPYRKLHRWAHMLGFGGHFLTKSRRYSVTFTMLRNARVVFRRAQASGPETDTTGTGQPTALVVNFLQFVGAGWQTPADAMLANTSAAMAREHQEAAREYLTTRAA